MPVRDRTFPSNGPVGRRIRPPCALYHRGWYARMNKIEKSITISSEELTARLGQEENIFGIITRVELAKRSGGLFNRKTMANWDSESVGFKRKLSRESDNQAAYYLDDVKEFIRENYRVVTKNK